MKSKYLSLVIFFGLLVLWGGLTFTKIISPLFVPNPFEFCLKFFELFLEGEFLLHILFSLYRIFVAFVFALVLGIPLGLIFGYFRKVHKASNFIIDFLRSLPVVALIPLFMLIFGIGNLSKILMGVWVGFFIVFVSTAYGVRSVKKTRVHAARLLGLSKVNVFVKAIIPEALPHIFAGGRVALSLVTLLVIAVEIVTGGAYGLGIHILDSQMMYRIPDMYVGIFVSGLIGYLLNKLFLVFERRLIHWEGK